MKCFVPFCLCIFFSIAIMAIAHAENVIENNQSNVKELLNYANQDLRLLDKSEAELVALLADRVRKRLLHPAFIGEMKLYGEDNAYVVYVELPLKDGYPGLCRMSATIMNQSGDLVTEPSMREFFMGSRNYVRSLEIHRNHGMKGIGDVLVAHMMRGGPHHTDLGKDYYTLIEDDGRVPVPRLILLARENARGIVMPLAFTEPRYDRDRIMGQTILSFDKQAHWVDILKGSSVPRLISALLFLSGTHENKMDSDYPMHIELVVKDLYKTGVLDDLLSHENSWIRQYATILKGKLAP